ncbi:lipid-binding SYLF domain-containing protein [Massilia arenae]|uniref:Lipid-binding SYLF domain-containing protein n=1 Tax=Massilia arenae TaxID=2603288 RepID=A0A5C7G0P4_9BURK|nr:lipid-binding SYLF domain-containing protein [Massilia arenae]TXF96754.1 lipid-binding SYLF domain-containing protein [Massilia arenae]
MKAQPGNTRRLLMPTILGATLALAACAGQPTRDETQARVDAAQATLNNFVRDPDMGWFREHVGHAKAVLISPDIVQAGFIVGGSGGSAVLIARKGDAWAGPAFYRIAAGSIGLQAGAQASEMVALVMTEKGLNSLLSTTFKLGADVSVAAGPVGAGTGAPLNADMVVYTRSKGLYGGLNLDGTVISVDDGRNHAYYGAGATPVEILVTRSVSNPQGQTLARVASGAVNGDAGDQ